MVLCSITPSDPATAPALTPVDAVFTPSLGAGEGRGIPARSITVLAVLPAVASRPVTCILGERDGLLACTEAGGIAHVSWRGFRPQGSTWTLPAHTGPGNGPASPPGIAARPHA